MNFEEDTCRNLLSDMIDLLDDGTNIIRCADSVDWQEEWLDDVSDMLQYIRTTNLNCSVEIQTAIQYAFDALQDLVDQVIYNDFLVNDIDTLKFDLYNRFLY